MALRAAQIRGQLTDLVARMDLDVISGADAAVLVREFSQIEKVAASARILAAARVADASTWVGEGDRSAEDWLSRQTGISVSAAARDLRTGRRVKDQPETQAAMRQGTLSPEQAGVVADAVEADPSAEQRLIQAASRETFKHLQDQARRTRAAATDDAARTERIRRARSARHGIDADGAFWLSLRGPASDGARFLARLKPLQEECFRQGRGTADAATRDTFDNRSYDAVLALLLGNTAPHTCAVPATPRCGTSSALTRSVPVKSAGSTTTEEAERQTLFDATGTAVAAPPGSASPQTGPVVSPTRPPGGNNVKVIVRVDLDALLRGRAVAGETSEIAGLGPVPVSVVREMLDDAFLAVVVRKGRDVVTVAHHGRGLNAHQRTAVEAQGLRCSNIACNQSVALQMDHRNPWMKEKITKLDNQDPLCAPCHRRKTHEGWHLVAGTGPRRFLPPARAG